MKYLWIRKSTNRSDYNTTYPEPCRADYILSVIVPDDFEVTGGDLTFTTDSTDNPVQLSQGVLTYGISADELIIINNNNDIKQQLQELDKLVPRALEDVISEAGLTLNENVNNIIQQKQDLRCQLK